jgi:hypothetical protein
MYIIYITTISIYITRNTHTHTHTHTLEVVHRAVHLLQNYRMALR